MAELQEFGDSDDGEFYDETGNEHAATDGEEDNCAKITTKFTRFLAFCVAALTVAVSLFNIANYFGRFCTNDILQEKNRKDPEFKPTDATCFGSMLFWNTGSGSRGFTKGGLNGPVRTPTLGKTADNWRSVFSLTPRVFVDLWTPAIFGGIALGLNIAPLRLKNVSDNVLTYLMFHVFMMLFGQFGYAGNLGVCTGFLTVLTSIFVVISMIVSPSYKKDPANRSLDLSSYCGCANIKSEDEEKQKQKAEAVQSGTGCA